MKKLKNLSKRGLSLLVCLMMCLSMLPGTAYAAEGGSIPCGKRGCNKTASYVPQVDPTCQSEGVVAHYTCSSGHNTDMNGNHYSSKVTRIPKADCVASEEWKSDGNQHWHVCKWCGDRIGSRANHDWNNATCTAPQTCKICSKTTGTALGHVNPNEVSTWQYDNTQHWKVCGRNGCTQVISSKEAHTVTSWTPDASTAHSGKVTQTGTCTVCLQTVTQEVDATGSHDYATRGYDETSHWMECSCGAKIDVTAHTEVEIPAVPATCEGTGLTAGSKCSVCNEVLVAQEVVEAKGHTEVIDQAVEATCTENGKTEGKHCSVCNKVLVAQQTTEKAAHTPKDVSKAPTCTESGVTGKTVCEVCNETINEGTPVGTLGHDFSVEVSRTEATCTKNATVTNQCSRCDETETTEVAGSALDHDFSEEWTSGDGTHWHACSRCDEKQAEDAHTYGEVSFRMSEDKTECYYIQSCTVCGFEKVLSTSKVSSKYYAATCKEGAKTIYTARTGYMISKGNILKGSVTEYDATQPALGHNLKYFPYRDSKCESGAANLGWKEHWECTRCKDGNHNTCFLDADGKEQVRFSSLTIPVGHKQPEDKQYVDAGNGKHGMECQKCHKILWLVDHSWSDWTSNGTGHSRTCETCNAQETAAHTLGEWTKQATSHKQYADCSVCGYRVWRNLDHEWDEGTVTVSPTCVEEGVKTYHCKYCNETYTESVSATGQHTLETRTTAPTCTEGGEKITICTVCEKVFTTEVLSQLGHAYEVTAVTPATCTAKGVTTYTCQREGCGHSYTEENIPLIPHTLIAHEEDPATCTEDGTAAHQVCSVCEGLFTGSGTSLMPVQADDLIIPATGHNSDGSVEHKDATCTEAGVVGGTYCTVCEEGKAAAEAVISATGHDLTETEANEPTCTEPGNNAYWTCGTCGNVFSDEDGTIPTTVDDETIAATDHDYGEWAIVTEPTTEAAGLAQRVCANDAEHVETKELPRLPDSENPPVVDPDPSTEPSWTKDENSTEPTCTEDGEYVYTLTVDETTLTVTVTVPATGHAPAEAWSSDGENHWHVCANCGEALSIGAHAYTGVVIVAPTATEEGVLRYTCADCGRFYDDAIPATGDDTDPTDPTGPVFPAPGGTTDGAAGGTTGGATGGTVVIDDEDTPLASITFDDVLPADPFYEAVQYVFTRGLMEGVSETSFDPHGVLNRAMVVTILYRLEGEPEAEPSAFLDVEAGKWYTDAIGWGSANGIVEGYTDERFGPMDPVTREQLAAILYRYANYKGYDVTAKADLSAYTDAASIHEYAVEAMSWAVELGAPEALTDATLAPRDNATRAQVAVAFMNFCEKYVPLETED